MRTHRLHRSFVRHSVGGALVLASPLAAAQQVTLFAAVPTPIPVWAVFLLIMALTITGLTVLQKRLPKSITQLRCWPLLTFVAAVSLATIVSATSIGKALARGCSACNFSMTSNPTTVGPVDWDQDITITNNWFDLVFSNVVAGCPTYAPCNLTTPTAPSAATPQCSAGVALARGASCLVRVETHAGSSLYATAAGQYVINSVPAGLLNAVGASSASSFSRIALEDLGGAYAIRSLASGKYFSAHLADSVVYADANDQAAATRWVLFVMSAKTEAAPASVLIFKDGPVSANVDVLQVDPVTKQLRVVTLALASAFSDANSQFVLE